MAEASGYLKAVPCELCGKPAKYQCQNCDDPLCTRCKEKHEKKKPHHKYVPYSQKEQTMCLKHSGHSYMYWCERCQKPCCSECVVTSHKRHDMINIEDALRAKKDSVRKNLKGPLKEILTKWRTLLHEAREMRQDYTTGMQKIDDDLVAHAARIHAAVDENLAKVSNELRKMQYLTETLLQSQEQNINDAYEKLQTGIRKLDDLQEGNDIRLLDCTLGLHDMADLPTLTRHSPPSYNPGQIKNETIMAMIGNLTTTIQSINKDQTRNTTNVTGRPLPHSPPTSTALLSTPAVVSSFYPGYCYPSIGCITSSGLAWVRTGNRYLQLMDRHGTAKHAISTDFGFDDVTVTLLGDILFSDVDNKRIVSASKGVTSWRFTTLVSTQYKPCGICCLRNGDVVVTHTWDRRVIQYNKAGHIIQEFDQNLFALPLRVAVNDVNDDLYVCDPDKHKVLTFGTNHSLRHEYTGSDTESFRPWDVCTDSSGRVLITDDGRNRIHILNKDGQFIRYLQPPGLTAPAFIDVDSEGNAWIWDYKEKVKIVKYQRI